jgi:hypothetical protein
LVVLEFELRASHLLGKCSIIWVTLPVLFCDFFSKIGSHDVGLWWLTPIILAIQEAEIRRLAVQSQPRQIVCETLFWKSPSQKRAGAVAQGVGPVFKPQYHHQKKKKKAGSELPPSWSLPPQQRGLQVWVTGNGSSSFLYSLFRCFLATLI